MSFVRKTKKIPDAVLSGDIATLGRGFCAEVGHFPSAGIAAFGGQGKENPQGFLPVSAGCVLPWTALSCSMLTWGSPVIGFAHQAPRASLRPCPENPGVRGKVLAAAVLQTPRRAVEQSGEFHEHGGPKLQWKRLLLRSWGRRGCLNGGRGFGPSRCRGVFQLFQHVKTAFYGRVTAHCNPIRKVADKSMSASSQFDATNMVNSGQSGVMQE